MVKQIGFQGDRPSVEASCTVGDEAGLASALQLQASVIVLHNPQEQAGLVRKGRKERRQISKAFSSCRVSNKRVSTCLGLLHPDGDVYRGRACGSSLLIGELELVQLGKQVRPTCLFCSRPASYRRKAHVPQQRTSPVILQC